MLFQLPASLKKDTRLVRENSVWNNLSYRQTTSMERCLLALLHWIFKTIFLYRAKNVNINRFINQFSAFLMNEHHSLHSLKVLK